MSSTTNTATTTVAPPSTKETKPRSLIEATLRVLSLLSSTGVTIDELFSGTETHEENMKGETGDASASAVASTDAPKVDETATTPATPSTPAEEATLPNECWCSQCPSNDSDKNAEAKMSYSIMDGNGKVSKGETKSLDEVLQMFFRQVMPPKRSWWEVTNEIEDPTEYTIRVLAKYADVGGNDRTESVTLTVPNLPECRVSHLIGNPEVNGNFLVWSGAGLVTLMHTLYNSEKTTENLRGVASSFLKFSTRGNTLYKLSRPNAVAPQRSNPSDAGFDLHLVELLKSEGGVDFYTTGVVLQPPPLMWYMLVARSSMAKSGYALANGVGIIDAGYRGEVIVALRKVNPDAPAITLPARWVQVVPQQWYPGRMLEAVEVSSTDRGASGGLGSAQFEQAKETPQSSQPSQPSQPSQCCKEPCDRRGDEDDYCENEEEECECSDTCNLSQSVCHPPPVSQ